MDDTLVLIPARMASTRLPGKPLAGINGRAMILHVLDRAREAAIGRPVICTDSEEIAKAVIADGGEAVMTRPDHASGSDRVFEAVTALDPDGRFQVIVNLQGDLPTLEPRLIRACLDPLEDEAVDIATLAAQIVENEEKTNPNVPVIGTDENYIITSGYSLSMGRNFTPAEIHYGSNVAILGTNLIKKLFKSENPIDKIISIGPGKYTDRKSVV